MTLEDSAVMSRTRHMSRRERTHFQPYDESLLSLRRWAFISFSDSVIATGENSTIVSTLDTTGCLGEMACWIIAQGADYVLPAKDNHWLRERKIP